MDVTQAVAGMNMTGCVVEVLTSSSFSTTGLTANSENKKLRVIFKGMKVKNLVTGVVKEIGVDNFYYSNSDANGYVGRAIPTGRADGAIHIYFSNTQQKLLVYAAEVMNKFDNESYEVTLESAVVLMNKY